jgi:transposase
LIPPVRTTWAPRGQTPILYHHWRRGERISIAGFICYHPDGRRVRLLTDHTAGAYNTDSLIQALQRLPSLLDRAPVILVWDGLPAHRSIAMKAWLIGQTDWLQVVRLPGYAPELNPAEPMWSAIKGKDLANYAATDLVDLQRAARRALGRIRRNPALPWSFLAHTGLTIPQT